MAMTPAERNRSRYDETLRHIESDLVRMGHLVLEMIDLGTQLASDEDPAMLEQVTRLETQVDDMEDDILQRVMVTLALESPVAHDLLKLTATMAMISELEKIGDEATKYATRIVKLHGDFLYELHETLQEMSHLAQTNLKEALRLYVQFSLAEADHLIESDDVVDQTYKASRNMILARMKETPEKARQLLRCAEVFHALEHISDHTVDMAKRLKGFYERLSNRSVAD